MLSLGHTATGFDCVAQTFHLMLLGFPPDMVRGVLSHRTRCCMTKIKHPTSYLTSREYNNIKEEENQVF